MVKIVGANVDLHVHSFMGNEDSIDIVLGIMLKNNLDVVAPSYLDRSVYHIYRHYAHHANQLNDDYGIIFHPVGYLKDDKTKINNIFHNK